MKLGSATTNDNVCLWSMNKSIPQGGCSICLKCPEGKLTQPAAWEHTYRAGRSLSVCVFVIFCVSRSLFFSFSSYLNNRTTQQLSYFFPLLMKTTFLSFLFANNDLVIANDLPSWGLSRHRTWSLSPIGLFLPGTLSSLFPWAHWLFDLLIQPVFFPLRDTGKTLYTPVRR